MGRVTGSGEYVDGDEVTVTAIPYAGYRFVRWSTGEVATSLHFVVHADVTLVAYFEPSDGIDDADASDVTVYSSGLRVLVVGAEGREVRLFDVNGRLLGADLNAGETTEFSVNASGVYLVKVGNAPAKRVLVVR